VARYGQAFKDRAVARVLPPESAAVDVVAREIGVTPGTLQRWREAARTRRASRWTNFMRTCGKWWICCSRMAIRCLRRRSSGRRRSTSPRGRGARSTPSAGGGARGVASFAGRDSRAATPECARSARREEDRRPPRRFVVLSRRGTTDFPAGSAPNPGLAEDSGRARAHGTDHRRARVPSSSQGYSAVALGAPCTAPREHATAGIAGRAGRTCRDHARHASGG